VCVEAGVGEFVFASMQQLFEWCDVGFGLSVIIVCAAVLLAVALTPVAEPLHSVALGVLL